jgi:hypothetical protein
MVVLFFLELLPPSSLLQELQVINFVDSQILAMTMPIKHLELMQSVPVNISTLLLSIQEFVEFFDLTLHLHLALVDPRGR